jgi:hypothetical protein
VAPPPARAPAALDDNKPIKDFLVDFWQERAGLPQKSVTVIHQTADGYLWIGTKGGLARFDGVQFEAYYDTRRTEEEIRLRAEKLATSNEELRDLQSFLAMVTAVTGRPDSAGRGGRRDAGPHRALGKPDAGGVPGDPRRRRDTALAVGSAASEILVAATQIANASREQVHATGSVAATMQAIANVTHESSAGPTEATKAVKDLVALSERLTAAISRFHIQAGQGDQ